VKASRLLELPEEAQELGLKPGDEVQISLEQNGTEPAQTLAEDAEQERFRALTEQLYAEADAVEHVPGTYTDPQKAAIAEQIVQKHRKMGMNL
jgi:hypothetical protein